MVSLRIKLLGQIQSTCTCTRSNKVPPCTAVVRHDGKKKKKHEPRRIVSYLAEMEGGIVRVVVQVGNVPCAIKRPKFEHEAVPLAPYFVIDVHLIPSQARLLSLLTEPVFSSLPCSLHPCLATKREKRCVPCYFYTPPQALPPYPTSHPLPVPHHRFCPWRKANVSGKHGILE